MSPTASDIENDVDGNIKKLCKTPAFVGLLSCIYIQNYDDNNLHNLTLHHMFCPKKLCWVLGRF